MANIKKIKLPDGTEYDVKDSGALPLTGGTVTGPVIFQDTTSMDEATIGDLIVNGNTSFIQGVKANQIVPFKSKTFTDVIGTENNWAKATFFFGSIKPTTWYAFWKIKFNIHIYVPGKDTYHQISEVMMSGDQGTLRTYSSMNTVANQLAYYGVLYRLKSAGFTNGYGHSVGCRFYSSNYPTDTNYKRTIIVDILETENCTFDFYDSCLLYADIPGTGTTNYDTYSEINWCSNGLQEAGDADTTDDRQIYFGGKTSTSKGIWAGSLFMEDGEGTYQNICAASDGTITDSNRTTATTKIANTSGFKIGGKIYYSNTNYGPNANISGWGVVYNSISLFDTRYVFNTTLTAGSLTTYKPLYLVGTVSNGLFYLDSTYYTQTPTTTGKIYILVGGVYDSTTSNCRMGLYQHNPWYYYDGSKLIPYVENAQTVNGHTINIDVPSNAKFTDTVTTVSTSGSGNAVTAITASNGALTVTKGSTFLTSFTETDPTVPAWAKAASKPTYTASEVGAAASSHTHSVTITPTTTEIHSMTSAGSVTAGTANVPTVIDTTKFSGGSFTRGTFNGGSFIQGTDNFTANTPTTINTSKFSGGSFTRGTFSQGTLPTLTMAMDTTDTKKLKITFGQGTLPTHAADSFTAAAIQSGFYTAGTAASFTQGTDSFTAATHAADSFTAAKLNSGFYTAGTANTPTAVTLPGRGSAVNAWTGYSSATANANT